MFWVGLFVSGAVGACLGLWFVVLVDWVRCHAVGVPDVREARTCPVFAGPFAWARIPWDHLADGHSEQAFSLCSAFFGALTWIYPWLYLSTREGSLLLWGWNVLFLMGLLFIALLDARWRILPIEPLIAAAVLFGAGRVLLGTPISSVLLGAGILGLFFGLQAWLSRGRWLGGGDPVLALAIGAALGWPRAAVAVYVTYLAVIPLLIVQLIRFKTWRRVRWPFGPLLAIGATVALVCGNAIWRWLMGT